MYRSACADCLAFDMILRITQAERVGGIALRAPTQAERRFGVDARFPAPLSRLHHRNRSPDIEQATAGIMDL